MRMTIHASTPLEMRRKPLALSRLNPATVDNGIKEVCVTRLIYFFPP
jgi:hypothetical protein